jgi:ribonuclease P protein component
VALPKRHRLRGHRAIDHLHRLGRRHHSAHLLLRVVQADPALLPVPDRRACPSPWRCALVISAKVHKRAVVRNRLRRLLHRHLLASLPLPVAVRPTPPSPLWLMVSLRPGSAELEVDQLLGECTTLLRRVGLLP